MLQPTLVAALKFQIQLLQLSHRTFSRSIFFVVVMILFDLRSSVVYFSAALSFFHRLSLQKMNDNLRHLSCNLMNIPEVFSQKFHENNA